MPDAQVLTGKDVEVFKLNYSRFKEQGGNA